MSQPSLAAAARALLVAAALLAAPWTSAAARTVAIPNVGSVEVPDGWTATSVDRGVQIATRDEEIYMWVEVFAAADENRVRAEHNRYFTGQGVAITGPPAVEEGDLNGVPFRLSALPATWQGARTILNFILVSPPARAGTPARRVLVSYWASPEGYTRYEAQVDALLDSIGASLAKL